MMNHYLLSLALLLALSPSVRAQEVVPLYAGDVPNAKPSTVKERQPSPGVFRGVTKPTLEVYLPAKTNATGTAVVVIPGGGYSVVVYQGEGINTAKALAEQGVAAFVLKYRLPSDSTMIDKQIGPLQDAQQAIKLVRDGAAKWGIDKNKVGIMGFSAGGHLAATAATHADRALIPNPENTSLRPDFQVLVYPVISMRDSLTHRDSRRSLLGDNPSKAAVDLYSNERHITTNTPPAYLTHAADDRLVDVDNSIVYFETLRHQQVPVELHVYPKGGHGFIFRQPGWITPLFDWMKRNNWIK